MVNINKQRFLFYTFSKCICVLFLSSWTNVEASLISIQIQWYI